MTMYVFWNWLFCIATFMLLSIIMVRYRFLFLKPSVVVVAWFHVQIQWAATVQAGMIEQYLPDPFAFFWLAQVFPFLGLSVSFFLLHRATVGIYSRITERRLTDIEIKTRTLVLLVGAMMVLLALYLSTVPITQTGIYAILFDPRKATAARESSLKLLDSALVKYGFSMLKNALAPLLCVLSAVFMVRSLKRLNLTRAAVAAGLIFFAMAAVSLPGARTPAAMLVLTVLFALFAAYKMPLKPSYIIIAFLLTMGLPVAMTIVREGRILDASIFFNYLGGNIMRRLVVVPMETALWHVHYAQTVGFAGVSGVPKLAYALAVEPINLANLIYLKYSTFRAASGLNNTCYVFSYYACFGMGSLAFSLLGLWLLDLAVLVLRKLRNNAILLAASAALVTSSFWFVSGVYTTVLLTNGFLFILLFAIVLDRLSDLSVRDDELNRESA